MINKSSLNLIIPYQNIQQKSIINEITIVPSSNSGNSIKNLKTTVKKRMKKVLVALNIVWHLKQVKRKKVNLEEDFLINKQNYWRQTNRINLEKLILKVGLILDYGLVAENDDNKVIDFVKEYTFAILYFRNKT